MQIGIDFKDPSTYAGIISFVGGLTSIIAPYPILAHVAEIITAVAGFGFAVTKNYGAKSTL